MLKAYKYRLLPTEDQKNHFLKTFAGCRFVYNLGLEVKKTAWAAARINLSAFDLMKQLTQLKNHEGAWLKELNAQTLESELTYLGRAYDGFFKGGGFPKFKSRFGRQSAEYRRGVKVKDGEVYIPKLGNVKFIEHRLVPHGETRTVTVSMEPTRKFFISILIKDQEVAPSKVEISSETAVGIDLGLKTFATISDGQTIENPKYLREQLKRLRVEQRKLARRYKVCAKEQSKSYHKQKMAVAKLHEKISNKRKDFLQKTSTDIIRQFDTIYIEDLNIAGMIQNNNLAKSISDVSWYEFTRMLDYKADWNGKNIIKIGRFDPSSKTCSTCQLINKELTLSDRTWTCENCGTTHDRDLNAAINIKNFGLKAGPSTAKVSQKTELIGCESMPPITTVAQNIAGLSGEPLESNTGYTTVEGHLPPVGDAGDDYRLLAEEIYNRLNKFGAGLGNASILIIQSALAGANSVRQQGEWQLCPKCNGTKILQPPYEVKGTSVVMGPCDICSGIGMVARPQSPSMPQPGFVEQLRELNPLNGALPAGIKEWKIWDQCCDAAAELLGGKGEVKNAD